MSGADGLSLDELMELATPLLREALDMPPEQAAVTALGRRIRAEVERIYVAGAAHGRRQAASAIRVDMAGTTSQMRGWTREVMEAAARIAEGHRHDRSDPARPCAACAPTTA